MEIIIEVLIDRQSILHQPIIIDHHKEKGSRDLGIRNKEVSYLGPPRMCSMIIGWHSEHSSVSVLYIQEYFPHPHQSEIDITM